MERSYTYYRLNKIPFTNSAYYSIYSRKMGILKNHFLIILLLIGLFSRLILTPIAGFKFDVDTWFAWAERLNSAGLTHFYSDQVWTGYTPGFLYILGFLGFIKNLFQINTPAFYLILKLPSILAELTLGILIYKIIPRNFNNWRKLGLIFILFNPAFIFNSSIFGQFDGLFSLTLLLSVYFLIRNNLIFSSLFWGLSFLLKPQAVLLLPVFAFYILRNFSIKSIFKLILPVTLLIFFSFLPFFKNNPFNGLVSLVFNLMEYYKYNSIFAYNLWGILGFWVTDSSTWGNISYQNWGYILFAAFLTILGYIYLWQKKYLSIYALSTLCSLSFFFLLTRMHERYLYPSLVFLIFLAILNKSRILLVLSAALSIIHFLNLYYVYVYYNEFYLNLPKLLYNPTVYNFLDTNSRNLSLISTVVFILISIAIVKYETISKRT